MSNVVLAVNDLAVEFATYGGTVQAVRGVSFSLEQGRTLAIVGESGCGKSVTMQSLMGLIPMPPGRITSGSAKLRGEELIGLTPEQLNRYRGRRIGMIFQDAMSALNPTMTIGDQIAETLIVHMGMSTTDARKEVMALLSQVQIPEPERRLRQYPFEFSGGMLQRAMIALSIACKPEVLIADEPTTALDVTIQAQILQLLRSLQQSRGLAIILITHDLGVVAQMAHDVAVMYAGKIVESGNVDDIFYRSAHPYTVGLKAAMPSDRTGKQQLQEIPGTPPDLFAPPPGCGFTARCPHAMQVCERQPPPLLGNGHQARCWLHHASAPAHPLRQQLIASGRT
ncbi:MAG TPA: ABC transporter ATP-binding protein [Candidatus Acidoferrum sp.]|nr:ABC transporter ATP-binding protein [Candidatus Acidoferrum sp.]